MKFKEGKRCDLCSHMKETSVIESLYFSKKHRIHGHLSHDTILEGKIRWYIYAIQDIPCRKIIVGSTQNPVKRWATHKSDCNQTSECKKTGLSKHFTIGDGCPLDPGRQKETLNFTLIDFYDTTREDLEEANHEKGPKCRCKECNSLKDLEDKMILKLGTFYGTSGLNERDEIVSKTRCNWKTN